MLPTFWAQHQKFLDRSRRGPIGLLFLGDSITAYWQKAPDLWQKFYGRYRPANFGIAGDRTQQVLWRIEHGELDNCRPRVIVLLIGINNVVYPASAIIQGNSKIVAAIHRKRPEAKVLLLGLFPAGRDAKSSSQVRAKIRAVNVGLAKLDDGNTTRFLDIGEKFLGANGDIPTAVSDGVHPSRQGYLIWAQAMAPLLAEMMKE